MLRNYVIATFILLSFSCNRKSQTTDARSLSTIDFTSLDPSLKDNIVNRINVHPIKDINNLITGYPNKILQSDNSFVLADLEAKKEIYLLNESFIVKGKIAKSGNGPEEYSDIYDLDYDPTYQNLVIMSHSKMVEYSLSGDFKRAITFNFIPDHLILFDGKKIIWNVNTALENQIFRFYELNHNYEVIHRQIPFMPFEQTFNNVPNKVTGKTKELAYFTSWANDTLYILNKGADQLHKSILNFGEKSYRDVDLQKFVSSEEANLYLEKSNVLQWDLITLTEGYIFVGVSQSGKGQLIIHKKSTKQTYLSKQNLDLVDYVLLTAINSSNVVVGNKIYFIVESEMINELKQFSLESESNNVIAESFRRMEVSSANASLFSIVELELKNGI
ncbi:MAG: 6-bladed beta-propeller [Bacteroidota bacterium]